MNKDKVKLFKAYLKNYLFARHTGGYGVHSPYLFHFVRFILKSKHSFYSYPKIENRRKALLKDNSLIYIEDFGTGKNRKETVSQIASSALQSKKYAQLFHRIIFYNKFRCIVELGTSLGITTSYLASASSKAICTTFEGSKEIAAVAKKNFELLGLENIQLIEGNIDNNLENFLLGVDCLDFVLFDANHSYEATIRYFTMCVSKASDQAIFAVDDILWSVDMQKAWLEIIKHPSVRSSMQLGGVGLLFFNKVLHKKDYRVRF